MKAETVTCATWNYNWHTIYNYEDDVAPIVPAGTLLHVITWFDNTSGNKFNPDPKNWVGAGIGRTIDEMGFSWIGWYDLTDEEYKAQLAERKAAQTKKQTQSNSRAKLISRRAVAACYRALMFHSTPNPHFILRRGLVMLKPCDGLQVKRCNSSPRGVKSVPRAT